jgi:hypothetical protein
MFDDENETTMPTITYNLLSEDLSTADAFSLQSEKLDNVLHQQKGKLFNVTRSLVL